MSNEEINDKVRYMTVITSYGVSKKTYKVERVEFDKSPMSTFQEK
jgi:hypothetical protein